MTRGKTNGRRLCMHAEILSNFEFNDDGIYMDKCHFRITREMEYRGISR